MSVELMIVFGVVGVSFAVMYNTLVSRKNEVENTVGGVHSYLQKRADLIPSLVATVKQYAAHETRLLTELTEARAAVQRPVADDGDLQKVDTMVSQMLGRVVAVAENYPDLKANESFLALQGSLNEIEGQLSAARRTYNAAVVRYNIAVESVPTVIIASILGYRRKPVFQVAPEAVAKPDIAKLFGQAS